MNTQPTDGAMKAAKHLGQTVEGIWCGTADAAAIIDREAVLPAVRELVEALRELLQAEKLDDDNLRLMAARADASMELAKWEGKP